MKKATSKILVAALSLIIAVAVATGTTFAWFSMNNKVTVTGMTVKTKVDSNILIAASTAGVAKSAESAFTQGIEQEVEGILQPASTINATSFFYTYDANADGSKNASAANVPYKAVSGDVITVNETDYKAYVDYVFELKAMNVSGENSIVLTKLNLLYDGAATDNHAFRVAIFSQAQSDPANPSSNYEALGSASKIFAPTGFAYFNDTAVSATGAKAAVDPAVNATSGLVIGVTEGKTVYYKITVRFWLEGEDTDCYNTKFVELTRDWTLDLAFELVNSTSVDAKKVTVIGSAANAVYTSGSGNERTVAVDGDNKIQNGEVASSYAWKKVGSDSVLGSTKTYTAAAEGSYYCEITTVLGNVYRTASFDYVATP